MTAPREVTDADGTTWSCVQAFAGLGDGAAAQAAAERAAEGDGTVAVVCTPGGGAQSVRLSLPADWAHALDDGALLAAIAGAAGEASRDPRARNE
jgi:hypothetical protein